MENQQENALKRFANFSIRGEGRFLGVCFARKTVVRTHTKYEAEKLLDHCGCMVVRKDGSFLHEIHDTEAPVFEPVNIVYGRDRF